MKKNESKSEILKTKVTPVYLLAKRGKSDVKDNVVQRVFFYYSKTKSKNGFERETVLLIPQVNTLFFQGKLSHLFN